MGQLLGFSATNSLADTAKNDDCDFSALQLDADCNNNDATKVADPVLPAECPGGCPPNTTCQNGTCVVDGEPTDDKQITITSNDDSGSDGSGSDNSESDGSGSGTVTDIVKAKGQNIIDKITTTVKNTDNKVLYGVGGGLALLTLISITQN